MLLLAGGCSPFSKVYSEEEPGVNLRKYRTYEWLDIMSVEKDNIPAIPNKKVDETIRTGVDANMTTLGYKLVKVDPDLRIHYHIIIKNEQMVYQGWQCSDVEWHKYGRCQRLQTMKYREGTLIVDFLDAQNSNQVWRGVASRVLENGLTEVQKKARIEEAIQAIFKKFPGGAMMKVNS